VIRERMNIDAAQVSKMRRMARTVAMISPSLLEDSRRMTSPSLEP